MKHGNRCKSVVVFLFVGGGLKIQALSGKSFIVFNELLLSVCRFLNRDHHRIFAKKTLSEVGLLFGIGPAEALFRVLQHALWMCVELFHICRFDFLRLLVLRLFGLASLVSGTSTISTGCLNDPRSLPM